MNLKEAIVFTKIMGHQGTPQEVLWQAKEACRALLAEVECLRAALTDIEEANQRISAAHEPGAGRQ